MAAQYPAALPVFTGSTETAPATTTPSGFAAWATKVADEIVALAQDKALGTGPFPTGLWHAPDGNTVGNSGYGTGTLILARYDFPPGTQITQLGEWIVTAGTAGALRRLCIYNDSNGYPGSLLKDGGTYAGDAGSGTFGSVTAFTAVDVGGTKWIGGVATVAATTVATMSAQGRSMALATVTGGNNPWAGYLQSGVTGALPDPFTSTRATNTSAPRVFFKTG